MWLSYEGGRVAWLVGGWGMGGNAFATGATKAAQARGPPCSPSASSLWPRASSLPAKPDSRSDTPVDQFTHWAASLSTGATLRPFLLAFLLAILMTDVVFSAKVWNM